MAPMSKSKSKDSKETPPSHAPPSRRAVWRRFVGIVRDFTASKSGKRAIWLFAALLVLLVLSNGLNVANSYVGRDFMSAIEQSREADFWREAAIYIGVFACSTVVAVFSSFAEQRLGLLWRIWLTRQVLNRYLEPPVYYLVKESGEVPNPDQRISEDIRVLTVSILSFALLMLNSTLSVIAFTGVLWSISPMLMGASVVYAVLGSLITIWLGRPLIKLNSQQSDKEANFRTDVRHIQEHSELVALLRRESRLKARLLTRLDELASNMRKIIRVTRNMGFFTNAYNYMIQVIPALFVAPFFIHGKAAFGIILQSALAFSILVNAFSLLVTQFPNISIFAAATLRLSVLLEAMEKAKAGPSTGLKVKEAKDHIAYQDVTLHASDGSDLISKLSLEIPQDARVLITGPASHAKAALFRATAGIGNHGEGTIVRPRLSQMHFLPENAFLSPGTLREMVLPDGEPKKASDHRIKEVLKTLHVEHAIEFARGLDTMHDTWDNLLSAGEQKLVVLARIFLSPPTFCFLDQIQTGLSQEQAHQALDLLCESKITYINIGEIGNHDDCYTALLELKEDGRWKWTPDWKPKSNGRSK